MVNINIANSNFTQIMNGKYLNANDDSQHRWALWGDLHKNLIQVTLPPSAKSSSIT